MQQLRDLASSMAYKAPPMPRDTSLDDFKIDFGLDLISRPAAGNIFQTAALSAKEPFKNFRSSRGAYNKSAQDRAINRYNAEANMFKTLIGAQADILGGSSGKSYRDLEIAKELEKIIPEIYELEAKQENGTITEDEIIQLEVLKLEMDEHVGGEATTDEVATAAESAVSSQIAEWATVPSLIQHALIILESLDNLTAAEIAAVDASNWDNLKTELDARDGMDAGLIAYLKQRIALISDNVEDGTIVEHN